MEESKQLYKCTSSLLNKPCRFMAEGKDCYYIHENEENYDIAIPLPCKRGDSCNKEKCIFSHKKDSSDSELIENLLKQINLLTKKLLIEKRKRKNCHCDNF